MIAFAAFLLAATLQAEGDIPGCLAQYQAKFETEAGITRDEWKQACRSGMDPDEYYSSRRTEKAQRAVFVVEEVLKTPAEQVTDASRDAFLAVEPALLPERLKKGYAEKKRKLLSGETEAEAGAASYAGLDEDTPVPASSARCPSRLPRAYSGWDELSESENRWLIKQTGCRVDQLEEKFVYCVAWEKAKRDGGLKRRFRWFLHPNDPIDGAIARYRTNGPDTTLAGTAFFGAGDSSFCK